MAGTANGQTNVQLAPMYTMSLKFYLPRVAKDAEITETALGKLMHTIWDRLNNDKHLLLLVSKKTGQGWNIKDVFVRVQRALPLVPCGTHSCVLCRYACMLAK
jgi:hypothetical protein